MSINMSLLDERTKNLIDATNFVEPKKIPVGIELITWPYQFSGVSPDECAHEPEKNAEIFAEITNLIDLDYIFSVAHTIGISFPYRSFQALGNYSYILSQDKMGIVHDQSTCVYMPDEDYDQFITDPGGYRKNVMVTKMVPAFTQEKEKAYQMLKNAASEFVYFNRMTNSIKNMFKEKNIVSLWDPNEFIFFNAPFNELFDFARGIKNSLLDIRKYPDKVRAALDAIWEQDILHKLVKQGVFHPHSFPFHLVGFHSESFLSSALFNEFWMKYFKEGYQDFVDGGAKFVVKGEGAFKHVLKNFRELPKGAFTFMLDGDDPFEVHKEIGDWCTLGTGIKSSLLKYGSKQECIDYVKKCVDTFAPGGGFIFNIDKPLLYAKDVKIENLVAAYETINDYGRK